MKRQTTSQDVFTTALSDYANIALFSASSVFKKLAP
jgi:hypothetical protein